MTRDHLHYPVDGTCWCGKRHTLAEVEQLHEGKNCGASSGFNDMGHEGPVGTSGWGPNVERIARAFHNAYERLAPQYAWRSQIGQVQWEDVPESNRGLMMATVHDLLDRGIIFTSDETDQA